MATSYTSAHDTLTPLPQSDIEQLLALFEMRRNVTQGKQPYTFHQIHKYRRELLQMETSMSILPTSYPAETT